MAGFRANVYRQIGASNHVADPRQDDDFYATDPAAVEVLVKKLQDLKLRKEKDFPQPFSLTGHENSRDLWIIDDVKTWVRERAKQNKANAS